jgi:putative tributyrin esterase
VTNISIQRYAEARNLAVITPSGDNSFYIDGIVPNNGYVESIGKELVDLTRKLLRLSDKREDILARCSGIRRFRR